MLSNEQYIVLSKVILKTKKRKNPQYKEKRKEYLAAKKDPAQNKKTLAILKTGLKRNKYLKNVNLTYKDLLGISDPKISYDLVGHEKAKSYFEKMGIASYFSTNLFIGGSIEITNDGILAVEEYRLEHYSKIRLPWISIIVAGLALLVSIAVAIFK